MAYAKGEGAKVASYAQGGEVLGRRREFLKEPVEFRDPDEGKFESADVTGDLADEDQKYGKDGPGAGKGIKTPPDKKSKPLKTVFPRQ